LRRLAEEMLDGARFVAVAKRQCSAHVRLQESHCKNLPRLLPGLSLTRMLRNRGTAQKYGFHL
jgi:hypothetical protein